MDPDLPKSEAPNPETPPRRPTMMQQYDHLRNHRLVKIAMWISSAVMVITILAVITVAILLNNPRVHTYVIDTVEKQASDSLGVRVQLQNFALNLHDLSLDLYGITVDGAAPYANPPLLQVNHAHAGVRIVSILHRKWYLDSVIVDRPIARIYVDAKGVSNIPTIKSSSSNSSSNTSIFDLAIRHAVLDQGEVYYNDRKSDLAADLQDVEFNAGYNEPLQQYSGHLAYANGHLISGSLKPVTHNLEAQFDVTPSVLHLSNAKLTVGASQLVLTATAQNYANPIVEATYDATIDGSQFRDLLANASVPTGTVRATGKAHYQEIAGKAAHNSVVLNGDLNSARLDIKSPTLRASVTNLAAHYGLANGDALLKDFKVELLGGELTASGKMTNVAGDSHTALQAGVHGVSLAEVKRTFLSSAATPNVSLAGVVNAQATATWGKTLNDLVAHADATINGQVKGGVPGAGQVRAATNARSRSRGARGGRSSEAPDATAAIDTTTVSTGRIQGGAVKPATTSANNKIGSANTKPVTISGGTQIKTAPAQGTGSASPAATSVTIPAVIPIESAIHGTYTAGNQQLAVSNSYLRTPQTSLTMNGVVSDRSSLALRLQAEDLREVEVIADLFRAPAPGKPLVPLGLAGTASFDGNVQGSMTAPHLTGRFVASNFRVNGSEWKVLRSNVDVSPSRASLQSLELQPVTRGQITLNASVGLSKWSFSNTSPIDVDLNASQLNIADLTKLAGQQVPVTGTLNASVKLHGTELNPAGNGNVAITNLVAYDQPVQSAKLTFAGSGDEVHSDLAVQVQAGTLQGHVSVRPQQRTYTAQLSSSGIQLDRLEALKARNVNATGVLSINASGQGSFDNPQVDATLQIPQLVIQNQTITALNLRVNVANHVGNADLSTSAANTSIRAKAKVELTGDYLADATVDTQAIPFQPILAVYAPEQAGNITGQTELHATLHGPLKNQDLLEAHVTIPMLQMAYGKSVQLAAVSPIHIDYKNNLVQVQRSAIRGTDTDIQFQGSYPTKGNGQVSVVLLGTVNLQLAQLFDPDIRSAGELKLNINSSGTSKEPNFGGEIQIVEASFATADLPVGLQHANGVLTLTRDRLNITKLQATVGGGTVIAQGGVALQPKVQFDLGLNANDIRILYPQGMRESVDARLTLSGDTDNAVLGGSVNLSDLSFTNAFNLSSFITQISGGVASPPSQGFSQNLRLNLAVRSSNNVNLVSRTLSIGGSANLQVRGTAAEPVILGRVNLTDGDIILNGDRFLLSGGTIEFVNPSETEPVVNLSLKTTIQQYDVYLRFNGPVNQLRTNYSSDPALPSADIINLLAFGQTTEASANAPSTPANQQAESLIASQVSSQVTSRISKIAGISQLSINPVLAGSTNQGPPGANITIQQRVTGNLFVTFTSNVASTQSQTIQGQYQLSPRVAISVTRDQNGGFAADALIKKTW